MVSRFEKHSHLNNETLGEKFISLFEKKEYPDPTEMQEYAATQGIAFMYLLLATIEVFLLFASKINIMGQFY